MEITKQELAALERVRRVAFTAAEATEKLAAAQAKTSKALSRMTERKWKTQMADLGTVRRLIERHGGRTE